MLGLSKNVHDPPETVPNAKLILRPTNHDDETV